MPKWTSAVYDDVRNALGNSIVFSDWKGRRYFRRWVKPFNPRTMAQTAHRVHIRDINFIYDLWINTLALQTAWNLLARDRRISGFNLYVSLARRARVRVPATATSTATVGPTITITGINPLPLEQDPANPAIFRSPARLYRLNVPAGTVTDITPAAGLPFGAFSVTHTAPPGAATYRFALAHSRITPPGVTLPAFGQTFAQWDVLTANGTAPRAETVVTLT